MDNRERIKKVMIEHLKSKGYPNMTIDEMLRELKPMWIKIEEAGLKQPGWSFQGFQQAAVDAANFEMFVQRFS